MGIQGLLPLLKDIQVKTSISNFSGQTVGIDAYCWLHKAGYGCAKDLALGKPTKVYVGFVIRRLNMLISHNITPIMIFDGGPLPAKAETANKRRAVKKQYRERGMAALKAGNNKEANENFQKCINVTPEMANDVIHECYSLNVQCIVAPYEADAQLAYLMKEGITQLTISEDSDLLLYGCNKVMYKMTPDGEGLVIDMADLANVRSIQLSSFTLVKFRHMCMLSGCDYLPSIKGLGLIKSYKALRRFSNVFQCIKSLQCDRAYSVPKEYEENFRKADLVFKYQLVFDIRTKTLTRLNVIDDLDNFGDVEKKYAGPKLVDSLGLEIAIGNLDPISGKKMADRKDFASGDISQKAPKSNSLESPGTNTSTAFHFQGHSQNMSTKQNNTNSIENSTLVKAPSMEKSPSSNLTANKSLKRLLDEEEEPPTRDEKIRKLYHDDNPPDIIEKEMKKKESPKKKSLVSHQNVFKKRNHKLNPFRSTKQHSNEHTEKVVSRFFDTRIVKAKENTILELDTPDDQFKNCEGETTESSKMDGSFIDFLDNTNLRGYEVKKLTLSPEKKEVKQKGLSPKRNKRVNMFSLFKKESDNKILKNDDCSTLSKDENVDFNITIPLEESSKDFKTDLKMDDDELKKAGDVESDLKVIDDEKLKKGDDKDSDSHLCESELEFIEFKSSTNGNEFDSKIACPSNKKRPLKLGLSRTNSKGSLNYWSTMVQTSKCDSKKLETSPTNMDSCSNESKSDLLHYEGENKSDKSCVLIDNDTLHETNNNLLSCPKTDHSTISDEQNEEPLPSHLRSMKNIEISCDEKKPVVIYLDEEEPLPFNIHGDSISNFFKEKSILSKLPGDKCKPIGLRRKQKQKTLNSVSRDKTKQMTFDKFAFKKKAPARSEDVVCLS